MEMDMPEAYLSTSSIIDSSIIGVSWLVDSINFDEKLIHVMRRIKKHHRKKWHYKMNPSDIHDSENRFLEESSPRHLVK